MPLRGKRWVGLGAATLLVALAACGGSSADAEAFCEVDERFALVGAFLDEAPEDARVSVAEVRDIFEDGVRFAPDDIRPQYELLVNAFTPILDVFEDAEFGAGETDEAALAAAFEQFSGEEIRAASDEVEAWVDANCSP